jgi:mannose-6-phosphate isomerase-like protein (cupin superfamily)
MHTTRTPQQIALDRNAVIHLGVDLDLAALAVTPAFWSHNADDCRELSQGRVLSVFDYTTTWPYWERHPEGDEFLYLLSGDVELHLDDNHQECAIALEVGHAAIVPVGVWHRAVINAPSRLLFITPTPARTEQRPI